MRARPTKTAKNSVGPISKTNKQTNNFARAAHFFSTFLCRCFAPRIH